MKVILLQDVPKIGRKYEVKEVANGYAQNFLLRQKLAEVATPAKVEQLQKKRNEAEQQHKQEYDEVKKMFASIHGQSVHMEAVANEQGHLFQGIKAEDIAKVVNEKLQVHLEAMQVVRQEAIKDTGEYEIAIEHDDLTATFTLVVKGSE